MENDPQSRVMIPSGIPGLDEMIGGGFIKDSVFVLIGETGTGRTMFSLQFLHEGLLQGEKVMYISLFNPVEQLTASFLSIYPDMSDRINKDLYIIQLPPEIFLTFSSRHGNNVAVMIKELGISRVVVNPFSVLEETLVTSTGFRSTDLNLVYLSLRSTGATTILHVNSGQTNVFSSKYGFSEVFADGVACMFREFPDNDHMRPYRMPFVLLKSRGRITKTAKLIKYDESGLFTLHSPVK
ncbi:MULTISPECIES: KaiC domain-containing protein [Methanocorpusculum]|uniref:KaiC domain-containing protein n=1 Tax=Methanocorpusculum parvum TaxID=2193 RepID=A0AAX0Q9Z9_9EURY|nr:MULTISPECIES: KaiC domain-containing protein [Methanocorpusculum]PAV09751.1 hypothetical protein ASJ83_05140 [Methanocorpusculum parvum]